MRNIDAIVLQTIKRSIEKYGNVLAFSHAVGIAHSTVLFWLSGKIHRISTEIWENKLFPVIENELCSVCSEQDPARIREKYLHPVGKKCIIQVPVIAETDLIGYEMPLENIKSFIKRKSKKKTGFEASKGEEYFSVVLQTTMQRYGIPWESIVFFSANVCFQNNMLVLIKFQDEQSMHICKFSEHLGGCSLFEFTPENSPVLWNKEESARKLDWAFPIAGIRFLCRKKSRTV